MQDGTDPWTPETAEDKAKSLGTLIILLSFWLPFLGLLAGLGVRGFLWVAGL